MVFTRRTKTSSIIVDAEICGRDSDKNIILRINKQTLIRMWMEQGFPNTENKTNELELESIGEDYFDDLVSLSFFQDVSVEDDGSKVHCKMHDLVHELTQFLTSNECFIKHSSDLLSFTTTTSKATHLTLAYAEKDVEPNSFYASINKSTNPSSVKR